ncbi:MAG: hypothetical protein HOY79_09325 [Streptomyces sp.]|nr:hypothetical protein [Streptomyces sp.]
MRIRVFTSWPSAPFLQDGEVAYRMGEFLLAQAAPIARREVSPRPPRRTEVGATDFEPGAVPRRTVEARLIAFSA